ncbi:T-cell receptor alpha chain V region CTL-L17 [Platysternon megacephalum]|nr:T-cell receptor alpha chain V region CTL-L17 [Platysternon megacephalum]
MFCRNHRSRVTVARGSALEMEIRRGRFRLSLLGDTPQLGPWLVAGNPLTDTAVGRGNARKQRACPTYPPAPGEIGEPRPLALS